MEKLKQIWNFVDGKKSAIGILLLIAAGAPWGGLIPAQAISVLYYFGAALAGVGAVHRKMKTPPE